MKRCCHLCLAAVFLASFPVWAATDPAAAPPAGIAESKQLPSWALGPFARPADAQPVLRPNPDSVFQCPMRGQAVRWEKLHAFNPAAVVRDGKICVLYRAEDDTGAMHIGGHTSRVGLAVSFNGMDFICRSKPVLFPADDDQKRHEWEGGCEDPRIAERPDGLYVMLYTQYTGKNGYKVRLGLATSRDLVNWTKHGCPFSGTPFEGIRMKSAAVVHEIKDGRLVAAKINGKYWMYFGEHAVNAATSDDLIRWTPLVDGNGKLAEVMKVRPGFFDSNLTEVGPQLVLTDDGIVLIYNGKNSDPQKDGDPSLPGGVYGCGQALFDRDNPAKLITRLDKPFFKPALDWERTGQYGAGTTFAEGLVLFEGNWYLYYGCADSFVGVAVAQAATDVMSNDATKSGSELLEAVN